MTSSRTRYVCLICLKRFERESSSSPQDNVEASLYQRRMLVPYTGLEYDKKSSSTTTFADKLEADSEQNEAGATFIDPYTKFLKLSHRYLKVPMAETWFENEKHRKRSSGEDLTAFCAPCQILVGHVCDLYTEFQTVKLHLIKKVEELEEVVRYATLKISRKLSIGLLKAVTEQLHLKSYSQLKLFRRAFVLRCCQKVKGNSPKVLVHRGLSPEEWKYTYAATKRSLMCLIVVFALATSTNPKQSEEITPAKVLKSRKRKLIATLDTKPGKGKVAFDEDIVNKIINNKVTKQEEPGTVIKTEDDVDVNVTDDNENVFSDQEDDGGIPETGGDDNDSDWAENQPELSAESDNGVGDAYVAPKRRRRRLRRTCQRYSSYTAEGTADENDTSEDDSDKGSGSDEDVAKQKVKQTHKNCESTSTSEQDPNDATISCKLCSSKFGYRRGLHRHLLRVHGKHLDVCEICGVKFTNNKSYWRHIKKGHPKNDGTFSCSKCDKKYVNAQELALHMIQSHSNKKARRQYDCSICGLKSQTRTDNKNHVFKCHPEHRRQLAKARHIRYRKRKMLLNAGKSRKLKPKPPKRSRCFKCNLTFSTGVEYLDHCNDIHPTLPVKLECPLCMTQIYNDLRFKEHLTLHKAESAVLHVFHCEVCGKTFYTEKHLSIHFEEEHQGLYKCAICNSIHGTCTYLQNHLEHHETEKKNFFCHFCSRAYTNEQYYQIHQKVAHEGHERIFCDEENCPEEFSNVDDLNEHLQTHLDELNAIEAVPTSSSADNGNNKREILRCATCNWGFLNKFGLILHELVHIPCDKSIGYQCPVKGCGRNLSGKENLISHYNYVHEKKYKSCVCRECGTEFSSLRWFKIHLRLHAEHKSGRKFICDVCNQECLDSIKLHRHKQIHNNGKPNENPNPLQPRRGPGRPKQNLLTIMSSPEKQEELKNKKREKNLCEICSCKFTSVFKLCRHLEAKHEGDVEEKKIACPWCYKKFAIQQTSQLHCDSIHSRIVRYVCDANGCNCKCQSLEELNDHLKSVHLTKAAAAEERSHNGSDSTVDCGKDIDVKALPEAAAAPVVMVESLSLCKICGWCFVSPDYRDHHELVHSPCDSEGSYPCPECETISASVYIMMRHHNGIHGKKLKPFKCLECPIQFTSLFSLKIHAEQHIRGTDLVCVECNKSFSNSSKYRRHQLSHNPAAIILCSEGCGKKFNNIQRLNEHMKREHGRGERYPCPICGMTFVYQNQVKNHVEGVHGNNRFECDVCHKVYRRKTALNFHKRDHAPDGHLLQYICAECGNQYKTAKGYKYHMQSVHTPEHMKRYGCPHCPYKTHRPLLFRMHLKVCLRAKGIPYDENKWGKLPQPKTNTGPPQKPGRKAGWSRRKKQMDNDEEEEMEDKSTTEEEEEEDQEPSSTAKLDPCQQPQLLLAPSSHQGTSIDDTTNVQQLGGQCPFDANTTGWIA